MMKHLGSVCRGWVIAMTACACASAAAWGSQTTTTLVSRDPQSGEQRTVIRASGAAFPFELSGGVVPGQAQNEGPGVLRPQQVVEWDGQWWAFGGELACGRHAGVWKWSSDATAWEHVISEGSLPDPSVDYVVWRTGEEAVWCSFADQIRMWRFDFSSNRWEWGLQGGEFPASSMAPFVLDDFVVWATEDRNLVVLRKSDGWVAEFPSDAWAGHLMEAASSAVVRISENNVLEFGQDENRLIRYDYGEKVRFADFQAPAEARALVDLNDEAGEPMGLPWVLLVLSWTVFVGWALTQRKGRSTPRQVMHAPKERGGVPTASVAAIAHWSDPLRSLVLSNKRSYTAAELDALWNIQYIESPETLRAKRSRIIQGVNTEFNLLYGYDLVRRQRDESDRRKVLYFVAALPPNLAKSLQRDGVHELHADDGPDGADGVAEDGEQDADGGERW